VQKRGVDAGGRARRRLRAAVRAATGSGNAERESNCENGNTMKCHEYRQLLKSARGGAAFQERIDIAYGAGKISLIGRA
jgi:hypothetical protein